MATSAISVPTDEAVEVAQRISAIDWHQVAQDLDARGNAVIERVLTSDECEALAALYPINALFRSKVVMARHGFGRGEYKYFNYPLPTIVAELRTAIYPRLAPIALRRARVPAAANDFAI